MTNHKRWNAHTFMSVIRLERNLDHERDTPCNIHLYFLSAETDLLFGRSYGTCQWMGEEDRGGSSCLLWRFNTSVNTWTILPVCGKATVSHSLDICSLFWNLASKTRGGWGEKRQINYLRAWHKLRRMTQWLPPKATHSTRVAVNVNCLILTGVSAFNRSCLFMRDREPYSEWFLCCLVEERDSRCFEWLSILPSSSQ